MGGGTHVLNIGPPVILLKLYDNGSYYVYIYINTHIYIYIYIYMYIYIFLHSRPKVHNKVHPLPASSRIKQLLQ